MARSVAVAFGMAASGLSLAWGCNEVLGIEQFGPGAEIGSNDGAPGPGARDTGEATGGDSGGVSGEDSGGVSGGDSGVASGDDGGPCTPGAQQCSGTNILTCNASGQWDNSWPCLTGSCSGSACTGVAHGGPSASCLAGGPGVDDCGGGSDSCCATAEIPGGTFERTYTNPGDGGTGESDPATVSGFRLDKYEVTVGRFRAYVAYLGGASGAAPLDGSGKHVHLNGKQGLRASATASGYEGGWDAGHWNKYVAWGSGSASTWTTNLSCVSGLTASSTYLGTTPLLPINCITWYAAYAFCIWDGGFLPSEAEWEYAAAAGSEQREYPWGEEPPGTGSKLAIYGCTYPNGTLCSPGTRNIAPVGTPTQGAALGGQLDLAGNISEWNLDTYAASYVTPCTDCASLATLGTGVLTSARGGSFESATPGSLAPAGRDAYAPASVTPSIGFRCARSP